MPRQRRFHVLMAAAAIAAGAMQVLAGSAEPALAFAPLLLIAGLLLSGRYLGEERILARRLRGAAVVSRAGSLHGGARRSSARSSRCSPARRARARSAGAPTLRR